MRVKSRNFLSKAIAVFFIGSFFMCLVGLFVVECSGTNGPSVHDTGLPTLAASGQSTHPTADEIGFVNHLRGRGIMADVDGDELAIGWLVCNDMTSNPEMMLGDAIDRADMYTGNHLLSVAIADAAVSHLCQEIDL